MADANIAADAAAKAEADAKLAATNATIEKLKADGAKIYTDVEMKEAIARRQEALDKLRSFEEKETKAEAERRKAEEDKMKRDGDTKQLLTMREQELAKAQEDMKVLKEKADKADVMDKSLREASLAKITDPDLKRFGEHLPTQDLLAYVEKFTNGKVTVIGDKGNMGQEKKLSDFKNADEYKAYLRSIGHL